MNQLMQYWTLTQQSFWRMIEKFEESSFFEKAVHQYETMEPRQQKWVRFLGKTLFVLFLFSFVFKPLWNTWQQRRQLQEYRYLVKDASSFQFQLKQLKQAYQRPKGWQLLPVGSSDQVNESLSQFLSNIGVSPDFYKLENQESALNLQVDELSIKQLNALLYQVEGYYPLLAISQMNVQVNAENKNLLKMSALIKYNTQHLDQFGGSEGGGESDFGSGMAPPGSRRGNFGGSDGADSDVPMGSAGARAGRSAGRGDETNFDNPPIPGSPGVPEGDNIPAPGRSELNPGGGEEFYPPEFTPPPEYIEEDI
ncbi:MAG: hypothetical protein KA116_01780 [Proteobacteria bacterium]|nr:hypothetical protein [Pseudomonadota bacterium]